MNHSLVLSTELIKIFTIYFEKCVRGYHLINKNPIKESIWESINTQILIYSGCTILSESNGSHLPGSDISSSIGNFSNKSVKYTENTYSKFKISSYRLTTVCSSSNPGNIIDIIAEIDKRKNFEYYSIIARYENTNPNKKNHYDWIIIPSNHPSVNPSSYIWIPTIGKNGKNKDIQIGWETNIINGSSMKICFSMSSQLWLSINLDTEFKEKYIVSTTQTNNQPIIDYIKLSDIYN